MDIQNFWALIVGAIAAIGIIELGLVLAVYSVIKGAKQLRKESHQNVTVDHISHVVGQ